MRHLGRRGRSEQVQVLLPAVAPAGAEARGDGGVQPFETPPALPSPSRRARLARWLKAHRPPVGITVLVAVGVAVSAITLFATVRVLLPPDGAHYIADADALRGAGVRPLRHPPLFPALVLLFAVAFDDVTAFQIALFISLALFIVGIYVLLRRWMIPETSLIGTAVGAFLPTTAEILGWGGGATLLGVAMVPFALAATERWIEKGTWPSAVLAGSTVALTALGHPLALLATLACIGPRLALLLLERRKLGLGWDPLGLKGTLAALAIVGAALVVVFPVYTEVDVTGSFGLRLPHIMDVWNYLNWAFGGEPFVGSITILQVLLWGLFLGGLVTTILVGQGGMLIYTACLGVTILVYWTSLKADPTYVNRAAYLLPMILAIGTAAFSQILRPSFLRVASRVARPRTLRRVASVGFIALLLLVSYVPRVLRVGPYYQELDPDDLELIRSLQGEPGAVATSWSGTFYGYGVALSWYVEGLAKRRAYGITAPWLGEVPEQRRSGLDMTHLFAGIKGIGNGAIQVAAGTPGMRTDPGIWVRVQKDYFLPMLYSNSGANHYPVRHLESASEEIQGDQLAWTRSNAAGRPLIRETASLQGHRVVLHYERLGAGPLTQPWSIFFYPGYGGHFAQVATGPHTIDAVGVVNGEVMPFQVSAPSANVSYQGPAPALSRPERINVEASNSRLLEIFMDFRPEEEQQIEVGPTVSFSEQSLLAEYNISTVIVWKDTEWRRRFDLSPCYQLSHDSRRILVYSVTLGTECLAE